MPFKGVYSQNFWKYSTSTETFGTANTIPYAQLTFGGSAVYATSNKSAYVLHGGNTTDFWKYSATSSTWSIASSTPAAIPSDTASVYSPVDNSVYVLKGCPSGGSCGFWRYSIDDKVWYTASSSSDKAIPQAPGFVLPGSSLVYPGTGDYIYAFQGSSDPGGNKFHTFWKYSISNRSWGPILRIPQPNEYGWASIVAVKGQYVYALSGFGNSFWKYTVANNTWAQVDSVPGLNSNLLIGNQTNLVYASSTNSLYMFPGNAAPNTKTFLRYDLSSEKWTTSTSSPYGFGNFTYSPSRNALYGFYSSNSYLQKFDLNTGTWSSLGEPYAFNSVNQVYGGIAYSSYNDTLYALPNQNTTNNFWYYPLSGAGSGQWHSGSSTPGVAYSWGSSMVYSPIDNSIYSLRSGPGSGSNFPGGDRVIMKYNVANPGWTTFNAPQGTIGGQRGPGLSIGGDYLYAYLGTGTDGEIYRYALRSSYYPSGNFTSSLSSPIDLGQNSLPTKLNWNAATTSAASVSFQLRSATTTSGLQYANWYGPSGTGADYYTTLGQVISSVHNGSRYFQYKAFLSSGDPIQTPTLNDVTINYNYYSTSAPGTLVSSAYNTKSDANVLAKMQWDATTPASTTVKFQISTAPDSTSTPGTPGTFSEFTGPTGTSSYFMSATGSEAMATSSRDGVGDQWIQYKAFLSTNDSTIAPSLGTTTLTYVVNAPPDFNPSSPVAASENTTDESIAINYSVRDIDTDAIGNKNNYQVTPSFQYSLDGGSTWNNISTSTLDAADYVNQSVATSSYTAHTARWNVKAQIGSAFSANTKIRVTVNDNEAANNTASSDSSAFILDTKIPTGTSVKIDATNFPTGNITLSASDDSSGIKMKVGQRSDLSDAPTYEAYNTNKSITLNSATGTVYAQFQDSYGNTTNIISTTLPTLGVVPVKIDASYSPSTALITLSSATAVSMKVGKTADLSDVPTWISYSATANLTVNQGDTVYAQFKDGNGNISPIFSATLPKLGTLPIVVDESQNPALVTLSATASTSLQMEVSQYSNFTGASYIDYSTTTTLTLTPGLTTVYARFKDVNGNITSVVSATPPTPGAIPIKVDASQTPALITLSATAATTTFQMEVGSNADLSLATYQNYNSTTTLPLSSSNSTAYVRFKDPNGNISAIYSTTPPNPPSNYFFQDLSNVSTSEWREFFAWGQSDSSNFQQYNVFRSTNSGPYLPLKTVTDKQTNYIVDTVGLDPNSMYSYEMSIQDSNGNISFISTPTRFDKPDGVGGSDLAAPTIDKSSVSVSDINTTGAAIAWTSNKFSNSVVYYIATSTYPGDVKNSYVGTIGVPSIVTSHSVKLSGLTPGTKYYFIVESTDSSGNIGHSSDSTFAFTTLPGPSITNVRTIEVKNNQAKIAWDTNIPADSTVIYSVNPDLKDPQIVSSLTPFVTDHRVTISDLTPGVQYYYFVKSVDEQNNIATNKNVVDGVEKFFSLQTTIDTVPPVISNVATSSVQVSGATITWITDKPSTAQIEYGTTTALGNFTATTTTFDSQHVVMLNDLSQSTTYYFRVVSTDQSGNVASSSVTSNSVSYTFTTITPNSLSGASSANITTTGATINWTSLAPSDSKVYYVATSTYPGADKLLYKNAVGKPEATTSHSIILSGLIPGTQYYFLTESIDAAGTAVQNASSSATFTTNPGPVISGVASSTAITSATISWNTNIPTDATVVYATSSDFSNQQMVYGTDKSTTTHSVTINVLTQGSTYYYYVESVDAENNTTSDKNIVNGSVAYYTFQTAVDSYAPVLSSVVTSTVGAFGATVTWTTNKPSVSYIEYGTTTALGNFTASTTIPSKQQVVAISNLASSTTYYFRVISTDEVGNTASSSLDTSGNPYAFTTIAPKVNDTTLPNISNVATSSITLYSANITWNTDKPTLAQVEYGTTTSLGSTTIPTNTYNSFQSIPLTGLTSSTTYFFRVISTDQSGNVASSSSNANELYSFTTLALDHTPPTITGVTTTLVGSTGAIASWTTDKPSVSYIEYGTTTALGSSTLSTTVPSTQQVVAISNLASSTTYYFRVISTDEVGNTASSSLDTNGTAYTFTTIAPKVNDTTLPNIFNVATSSITLYSANITWNTDKPTVAKVEYGTTTALGALTATTTSYNSAQSVPLTGLTSNTTYYFRVISTDQSSNVASSTTYTFTTLALDHTPPTISDVKTALVGSTGAIASWTTNKSSISLLEWGTTTALGNFTATTTISTTQQVVVLSNLASSTTYYFRVISADQSGNVASDDNGGNYYSFITVPEVIKEVVTVGGGGGGTIDNRDLTTPFVSDIKVVNITRSSAVVTFTTSKVSNGLVKYGLSNSYNKEAGDTGAYGLSHSVVVNGLQSNTKYYYQIKASDIYQNIGVSGSFDFTTNNLVDTNLTSSASTTDSFAKKALGEFNKLLDSFANNPSLAAISEADLSASLASFASKVISAPIISGTDITVDAGADTATIKWTTDKESNSMLAYAQTSDYDSQRENPYTITAGFPDDNVTVHEVKLQNLAPNTVYHFQTRSQGKLGPVAISKDRTFTTTSLLPEINNARFGDIKENQAVLNWRTDVPTKTVIEVKDSTTGKIQTFEDTNFVQDHNFALNNLKVSNGYTARIISTDSNKNTSTPFIMPFFTSLSKDAAKISNVRITTTLIPDQADAAQTIISWKTDKPATSKVWFSEGGGKDFTQSTPDDSSLVTEHTVITTLLRPGLVYKIVVESDDSVGNVSKSNVYTALTPKQQGSIVDVIFQNFNKTFGFLKK